MMYAIKLSIITIYFLIINFANTYDTSTLKLLQIIHRHGDRTPISFYKTDPYIKDEWVDGLGELTPKGKERMFNFGTDLRKRYDNYLTNNPKNIRVRSSASERCLESAAALVAGMYPPKDRWVWSDTNPLSNNWQPIAIQTVLKSSDGLLVPGSDCPAAESAYQQIMRSKEVQDFMNSQKDFIEKINKKLGENYTQLRQLDYLYDNIHAEMNFDIPFPEPKWLQEIGNDSLKRLEQFQLKAFQFDWSSKTVQRLRSGLLLKELIGNINNATNNKTKKVYSYSTHDTIIVTLLQALGLYTGIPVSYGSALIFELHENHNQSYVHLIYANVTPSINFYELNLTICAHNESFCELSKFSDSVKEYIPVDWNAECNAINDNVIKGDFIKWADAGIGFAVGVVTIITLISVAITCKKCRTKKQYFANSNTINNRYIDNV